jgi:serine/threonine protein kinase
MESPDRPACPDRPTLQKLEAGELPDQQADDLFDHVATCRQCLDLLDRFRTEDLDSRVLRSALNEPQSTTDPSASTVGIGDAPKRAGVVWEIPDYERVRMCGAGSFGTVWAVRDRVGMHRALKTIDLDRMRVANVRCRESTALEAYCRRVGQHPNLIQIFHVGIQSTVLYYTMELADDDLTRKPVRDELPKNYRPLTLERVIKSGPTSPDTAIEVCLRLLRGLCKLHGMGLAHRDIKPANIVFVDRQPKLADIGMITATTHSPSQVGTPDYMPPDGRMDETADVFAIGRVLFEILVSMDGPNFPRLPDDLRYQSINWDMDKIGQVIARACSASGEDRYASAERMVEAMESCRNLQYDSLFDGLAQPKKNTAPAQDTPALTPIVVAAINALPWVIGAFAAIILIQKFIQ